MQLTPNFTLEELCTTNKKDLLELNINEAKKQMGRMYQLAGFAQRIREIIRKPIIVTSGFRCVKLNNAVGGSLTSQHLLAEALDIKVSGKTSKELIQMLIASDLKYDQIIWETSGNASWAHVSIGSKKEKLRYLNGKYSKLV